MLSLQSRISLALLSMSLLGQSVFANNRHEEAIRTTLSTLVESASQAPEPDVLPDLHSGLKLLLKEGSDPLPEAISYSLHASSKKGESDKDEQDRSGPALTPGLYELAIQEHGHEVYRKQILAIDKMLSGLEVSYSQKNGYSLRQTLDLPQIKFVAGQKRIAKPSIAILKNLAAFLKKEEKIEVFGFEVHTDAHGDRDTNQELTQARAIEVRNFLVKNGVDPQRIHAEGFGSDRPLASNDTQEGRLLNRRVEYVIIETSEQPKLLGDR